MLDVRLCPLDIPKGLRKISGVSKESLYEILAHILGLDEITRSFFLPRAILPQEFFCKIIELKRN